MRLLLLLMLSLMFLVCITREFGVGASEFWGASAAPVPAASHFVAFDQQGQPIRAPDSEAGQPGTWPAQGGKRTVDVTALKGEANLLIAMSQALPGQLEQLGNGKFPKELVENLRKIEKLSKHIRSEIE